MRITNIKGFGMRRPVRPSQCGKVYFDPDAAEEHELFKNAWREIVYDGFYKQTQLSGLVIRLKETLDRMNHVVYHTAPFYKQYHNQEDRYFGELVELWGKLMDHLSQLNAYRSMYHLMLQIDSNFGTGVQEYMQNDTCNCELITEHEIYDPGPMPEWLRKELIDAGHDVPDDDVVEYNKKRLPFDYKFLEEKDK